LQCLATKTKLQDHVATSAPYCSLVALLCLLLGHLPIGLGLYGPFVALAAVVAAQTGVLILFGEKPESPSLSKA
jgi:Na+/H+ antiporter NhaC